MILQFFVICNKELMDLLLIYLSWIYFSWIHWALTVRPQPVIDPRVDELEKKVKALEMKVFNLWKTERIRQTEKTETDTFGNG